MTENIKDALQYAVELSNNETLIITDNNGKEWFDVNRHNLKELIPKRYYPKPLHLSTLKSLSDYYKANNDGIRDKKTIVVIETPTRVAVYSYNDDMEVRSELLLVQADVPNIEYGQFLKSEFFNIMLQSRFVNGNDRELLLDYASKISIENGADIVDDGASQVTTIRSGVANKTKGKAPNPVSLAPYRTFVEVTQPYSDFVFRINKDGQMALFEADGGSWKNEAKGNIMKYLLIKLDKFQNVTILA